VECNNQLPIHLLITK